MSKLESDYLTIAMAKYFLKGTKKSISDFIPEFNDDYFTESATKLDLLMFPDRAEKIFTRVLNQSYKRIMSKKQ